KFQTSRGRRAWAARLISGRVTKRGGGVMGEYPTGFGANRQDALFSRRRTEERRQPGGPMPRTTFVVDDPMTRNAIHVLSRAPLETILVRTNDVRGEIEIDPDNVTDRPHVAFEVAVDALDSGVPLMNDVMRGDHWLDVAKSPVVRFALGRV